MVQGSTGAPRSVHKMFDWIIIPHGRRMHGKAFCFTELGVGSNVDDVHDKESLSFFLLHYVT